MARKRKRGWRDGREYRVWRVTVVRRDKVCVVCSRRKRREAHHIQNGAHHPAIRFDPENGVTLCKRCHWFLHNRIKSSYKRKTTAKDLGILQGMFAMMAKLPELPSDIRKGKIIK